MAATSTLSQFAHFLPNRFLRERPPLAEEVTLGCGLLSSLPAMRLHTGTRENRGGMGRQERNGRAAAEPCKAA